MLALLHDSSRCNVPTLFSFNSGGSDSGAPSAGKRTPLNSTQIGRLRNHCVELCSRKTVRREVRALARLMIIHADADLVLRLQELADLNSLYVRRKARRVLHVLTHSRRDLFS